MLLCSSLQQRLNSHSAHSYASSFYALSIYYVPEIDHIVGGGTGPDLKEITI